MIGLGLRIHINQLGTFFLSLIVRNYVIRVKAAGGIVESIECLQTRLSF